MTPAVAAVADVPAPTAPPVGATRVFHVTRRRKLVKPVLAGLGLVGTIVSIWWFALKPRRNRTPSD